MSAKHWLSVRNESSGPAEILIQGQIGKNWWDDSGTSEKEFTDALKAIPEGREIIVGINSEGGSVQDGLGIYNALLRRGEKVTTRIDGYAVSIASVIALAGAKRVSPKSSIWMIHEPWMMAAGNAADMRKAADALETHGKVIADIYHERTGMSVEDSREKMKAETWFNGADAVTMGFATHQTEEAVALNKLDPSKFRNIPQDILKITLAAASKGDTHKPAQAQEPITLAAANNLPEAKEVTGGRTEPESATNNESITMPEANTVAAPTGTANTEPGATQTVDLSTEIAQLRTDIAALRNPPVTTTATARATVIGDAHDRMLELPEGAARRAHIVAAWNDIQTAMRRKPSIVNVNTITTDLTTNLLSSTVITTMGTKLAALGALFVEQLPDPVKPKATINVPIVTTSSAMLTNPTDWESGDATVDDVAITMNEYAMSWHVTNAQLQSGTQIGWLVEKKASVFAESLMGIVLAPLTIANYGAACLTSAAAAFGPSDLATIWAAAKNYTRRNLVLDGGHFARLGPTSTQTVAVANGAAAYWFDSIYYNNKWPAGENVVGFVASPEALVVAAGLPQEPPGFGTAFSSIGSGVVPGINLRIQTSSWIKPGTRVQWQSYDLMLGVAAADTSALELIVSA